MECLFDCWLVRTYFSFGHWLDVFAHPCDEDELHRCYAINNILLMKRKDKQTNKIQINRQDPPPPPAPCGVHACKFPWLLLLFFKNYYFIVLWYFYKTKVQWQESGLSCNSPSGRFRSLSTSLPSHPPPPAPDYLLLGIRWWRFIGCYCVFVWLWKSGHQHLFFLSEVPSLSIGYD